MSPRTMESILTKVYFSDLFEDEADKTQQMILHF